jgi:hypothetical protein
MALGGQSQTWFFLFFRGEAAKKEEKRIFLGDCIPQTPALQSGKPRKLTPMGESPPQCPAIHGEALERVWGLSVVVYRCTIGR